MTTYADNLTAVEQKPFIELFKFQRGEEYAYYTSYNTDIVFNNQTYVASSITRGPFTSDTNLSVVTVEITAAIFDEFASYIADQPSVRTTVTVYRAVSDELGEYVLLLEGNIVGISFTEENSCTVKVQEDASVIDREIDMIVHSATCNNNVFYDKCRLDPLLWRVYTDQITVTDGVIYCDQCSAQDDGFYSGGEVHYGADARLITSHIGNALVLHVPFDSRVTTGTLVEIFPGCDRRASTCVSKFNNLANFVGMPYIPDKNPTIWGI